MIWLTLRQARRELLFLLGLYMAALIYLLWTGISIHADVARSLVLHCEAPPVANRLACSQLSIDNWSWVEGLTPWLGIFPALFGFLVGVPLLAQEAEQGTLILIWTQSVTRQRWVASKLGICLVLVLIMAVGIQEVMQWWNGPFTLTFSRLSQPIYDFEGILPYCLALAGFALGLGAGVWLRRTALAVAVTLGSYLALWLGADAGLRFHLVPSLIAYSTEPQVLSSGSQAVLLDQGWVDVQHHIIDTSVVFTACDQPSQEFAQCLHDHAWLYYVHYLPDSSLGQMQAAEGGIICAVAVLCLVLAWWRILHMHL